MTDTTSAYKATMAQTAAHIQRVNQLMVHVISALSVRAACHDASKLHEPEVSVFHKYTPLLAGLTYGSQEYKSCLDSMAPALDHHYQHNRHHPEHFDNGVSDMTLIDIIEMLIDWMAAVERHDDGDINKSIEINSKRFGIGDQLKEILLETAYVIGMDDIASMFSEGAKRR